MRVHPLERVPDLLALHAVAPQRYPYLLESVAQPANVAAATLARFDILFAFPADAIFVDDFAAVDFFSVVDTLPVAAPGALRDAPELPFTGGWFLFLSYEAAQFVEPSVGIDRREPRLPLAYAARVRTAIVRRRDTGDAFIVCENEVQADAVAQIRADLARTRPVRARPLAATVAEESPEIYLRNIARVQDYIRAGDVFQVNLSREWRLTLHDRVQPFEVYDALRRANPAPFAGLAVFPQAAVVSSSPERLVELRRRVVRTRPIAGTHPRSEDPHEDAALSARLLAHPKERAEHVMLIDLERNDLGRISETGSVAVPELMTLESYRYVHHIVSEVRGHVRTGVGPGAVLRAVFPGGTITGCPKIRCMQILQELEHAPRGAYTGAMGYLNRDGSMELNILIRTLTHAGREVRFRAGGGIVADSDPARELNETRAKARGLLRAFGLPA